MGKRHNEKHPKTWARVCTAIRNHDFFSAKERALPPQPPKNSLKIIYADINGKKDW